MALSTALQTTTALRSGHATSRHASARRPHDPASPDAKAIDSAAANAKNASLIAAAEDSMKPRFPTLFSLLFSLLFSANIAAQQTSPQQVLFTNVKAFDGISDSLRSADVLTTGNLIDTISDEPLTVIQSTNMTVIDGGRTLMPGLIDSHAHLTHVIVQGGVKGFEAETWVEIAANAVAGEHEYLMNGFTTVRDMGGMGTDIKRSIDRGLNPRPRIYAAGAYIAQSAGHAGLRLRSQPNARPACSIPFF